MFPRPRVSEEVGRLQPEPRQWPLQGPQQVQHPPLPVGLQLAHVQVEARFWGVVAQRVVQVWSPHPPLPVVYESVMAQTGCRVELVVVKCAWNQVVWASWSQVVLAVWNLVE